MLTAFVRAPVLLELRFGPGAVEAQIFFKGFEGDYVEVSRAKEARKKVQAAMETLKVVGIALTKPNLRTVKAIGLVQDP